MQRVIITLVVLCCALGAQAQERRKEFTGTYPAGDYKEITLSNRYGNIEVRQGGDQFEVQAVIVVRAKNAERATEVLQYIRIETEEVGGVLHVRTMFDKDFSVTRIFSGITIEIDYRVRIPRGKAARIVNRDGGIAIGDFVGDLTAEVVNGNFTGRSVTDGVLAVSLSNGEFDLPSFSRLTGEFRNATVKLGEGESANLTTHSSSVRLIDADELTVKSSSGSCYVGNVETLNIHSSYTKYEIQDVGGTLRAETRWGEVNVRNVDYTFSLVEMTSAYTRIGLTFMEGSGYQLEMRYNKSVKRDLHPGIELVKKPTGETTALFEAGFVGDRKMSGRVNLNLSAGSIFIQ